MKLVIVESPSKAKTIQKYLGKDYMVDASGGHIRDLPTKSMGIEIKKNFNPKYVVDESKKETIERLKDKAKKVDEVLLATDPDREGEAISWHLAYLLGLPESGKYRIEFNEISKNAVNNALTKPREININLVDAQQARRVLDRLVGYKLSPLICQKVQDKLSAGRVQSVALRLIVEREREIQNFVPVEYWTMTAFLFSDNKKELVFKAVLHNFNGKKINLENKEQVDKVLNDIKDAVWKVENVKKTVTKSHAPAPFTTSTLQQDASSKLNMSSPITMRVAQQLYEGIDFPNEGHIALVTYIRTDSVRISSDAQKDALKFIEQNFGKEYVPETPNFYKSKKNAQDAHEAIRPISLDITPESIKDKVELNQYRLYKLIYQRFLASQMSEATYNSMTININANGYGFKASGKTPLFKGWTTAYTTSKQQNEDDEELGTKLPNIEQNEALNLKELKPEQKFTKPPARYTEASLVKTMEENGIGRPSTYASIISVLFKRNYTERENGSIKPTEIAFEVNDLLLKYFDNIINVKFTANMEEQLDEIEDGGKDWHKLIADFYPPFIEKLNEAQDFGNEMTDIKCEKCGSLMMQKRGRYGKYLICTNDECKQTKSLEEELTDIKCDKCGSNMLIRRGRFGKFLACSNYPECSNIKSLEEKVSDKKCPKCGTILIEKKGRFGKYLSCPNEECKHTESVNEVVGKCPKCGKDVARRRSRTGKIFYGCTGYPDCDFLSWDIPSNKKCPDCGSYLVIKNLKNGDKLKCSNKECGHVEDYVEE